MYNIGDYVVKPNNGVCKIDNITHLDIKGIDKNKLYYLLIPINDEKGKIYLPVDAPAQQVRKIMTSQEAYELLEKIPYIEEINILNDKLREQKYKEVIKSLEPESLLRIIKTIYLRRKDRTEKGRKNTAVDEKYFKLAEEFLFSELCLVLEKNRQEIHHLILEKTK